MKDYTAFRERERIENETVVFTENNGVISGNLAFDNPKNLRLFTRGGAQLEEKRDFLLSGGKIILKNEKLPHLKKEWLLNKNVPESIPTENERYGIEGCMLVSPEYLRTLHVLASYDCDKTLIPQSLPEEVKLPLTRKKLFENKKLTVALYGDSVCNAANSSWEMGFGGYEHWFKTAISRAEELFGAKIEFLNFSRSGYGTEWGISAVSEKFSGVEFDLVVLGLGGNDAAAGMPCEKYLENLNKIIGGIRGINPAAEFILLSPTPQNPACTQIYDGKLLSDYVAAQRTLICSGVSAVDLSGVFCFLNGRKNYCEFSGNNLNHPNDFWYGFYSDAFAELFYKLKIQGENAPDKLDWSEYFAAPGFESAEFSALPKNIRGGYIKIKIKGKEIKTFAFIGKPEGEGIFPAVVLAHGAGGNAFYEWVKEWTDRGYVAVAVDLGCYHFTDDDIENRKENPSAAGFSIGGFAHILKDPRDSWIYYSVANIIAAHSYLISLPYVDACKTGLAGISWGGVVSLTALGIDNRFAAGAIIYSAGFITEDLLGQETGIFVSAEKKEFYDKYYDPRSYVSGVNSRVLMQAGLNDAAFSPFSRKRTYSLFAESPELAVIPDLYHDNVSNFKNKNVYAFMGDALKGDNSRVHLSANIEGGELNVTAEGNAERAEFLYTDGVGDPHKLVWKVKKAEFSSGKASEKLPVGAKYVMLTAYYGDGLYTSTDIFEIK